MTTPPEKQSKLRVLCLEDSPADAELVAETLAAGGYELEFDQAAGRERFAELLAGSPYDVILADYSLPSFSGRDALAMAAEISPATPFIFVSGTIGEETTVELLKAGADDCVLKDRLARLPFAVSRAIAEKAAERELRESENLNREILEYDGIGVSYFSLEGRVLLLNRKAAKDLGIAHREGYIGKSVTELFGEAEGGVILRRLRDTAASPEPLEYEDHIDLPSGRLWLASVCIRSCDADGKVVGVHVHVLDVTERKRAEQELRDSEERLSLTLEATNDGMWDWNVTSGEAVHNARFCTMLGYEPDELPPGLDTFRALIHPQDLPAFGENAEALLRGAQDQVHDELRLRTKTGAWRWMLTRVKVVKRDAEGGALRLVGTLTDVTERRNAEAAADAAASAWRQTFDAMADSVAVFDGEGIVRHCNAATGALAGRERADILGRPCYEVFHGAGDFRADCPQRRAHQSGVSESGFTEREGRSYRVTFVPQLDEAGRVSGGVQVLTDVTELKRVTEGVIAALTRSIEARDPYTAGHQHRVSELAVAIGRHLGLEGERLRGLEVAGLLHDLGKITIPAEILSKPGRLTETEFALIKGHPEASFEVLAAIDFHWPVAKIARQHHERLDGSGYPRGLKDEEILLEAKILAVADVVEAMISHRPYRAALSLETALAEIEGGAGSRYDAAACEAAVALFREGGFTFKETP
jgi:PAS domain S-box-containing protein